MGVWSWVLGRDRATTARLSSPETGFLDMFAMHPTVSGAIVSPATAMRVPAVAGCVRAIAEAAGVLPVKLYKRLATTGKEPADSHPAYPLVHDDANGWTSASAFRTQLTQDALLYGGGYGWVNRVDGKPYELIRFAPETVTVEVDKATSEPSYRVQTASGITTYGWADIIHISAPSVDGKTGIAPISSGREAIALALVLELHASKLFGAGARPNGILKAPEKLNDEAMASLKDSWSKQAAGGTAVLENGITWEQVTLKSTDAQFAELREAQTLEICRLFRVPPVFIQDYSRMTWNNGEGANRAFLQHCLSFWLQQWESAYRRVLLTDDERKTLDFDFVLDDLLRADTAARFAAYSQAITSEWLSANEVRALENRPPREGGDTYQNPATSSGAATGGTNGPSA